MTLKSSQNWSFGFRWPLDQVWPPSGAALLPCFNGLWTVVCYRPTPLFPGQFQCPRHCVPLLARKYIFGQESCQLAVYKVYA